MKSAQHREALDTLSRHGKTFRWASVFLADQQLYAAAELYQLCRELDDIADTSPGQRDVDGDLFGELLARLKADDLGSTDVIDKRINHLVNNLSVPVAAIAAMIEGFQQDIQHKPLTTEGDLLRYCYHVAGTVGLMMCPILGVTESRAFAHAIDLGIAMQLTNISRDVLEDAVMGRRYLPMSAEPASLAVATATVQGEAKAAINAALDTAEQYYNSGLLGLVYLPRRNRVAILLAAHLYRAIGRKLRRKGTCWWQGRTMLSKVEKAVITLAALPSIGMLLIKPTSRLYRHDAKLHHALKSLPFTHV